MIMNNSKIYKEETALYLAKYICIGIFLVWVIATLVYIIGSVIDTITVNGDTVIDVKIESLGDYANNIFVVVVGIANGLLGFIIGKKTK